MYVCEFYEVIKTESDADDSYRKRISVAKFSTKQAAKDMVANELQKPREKWSVEKHTHLIYSDVVDYESENLRLEEIKQQALAKLNPLERKALGLLS